MVDTRDFAGGRYLGKEDFDENGTRVQIESAQVEDLAQDEEDEDRKIVLYFKGMKRGMTLNKTNVRVMQAMTGEANTDHWIGKEVVVYSDPNVSFGGKLVGGLRVRAPA